MNYRNIIAAFAGTVCLIAMTGCYSNIGPGHVGILVQNSGTDKGVLNTPVKTGRVWYNPFSETVIEYPTNVHTLYGQQIRTKEIRPTNPLHLQTRIRWRSMQTFL
jgi:hypothetical protein